jgi:uncharacterized membrane protein
MEWYEKAEAELIESFNNGDISNEEYKRQLIDIKQEYLDSMEFICKD